MLYIFQVDTGTMLTFDMNLAMDSVSTLSLAISSAHSIPPSAQVLLISGGIPLESNSRVCAYPTAGTDTNPIFLFNKQNIENNAQLSWQPIIIPESLLNLDLEGTTTPSYATLQAAANKAAAILELMREIVKSSEQLIWHQHLQHLGWGAVVANLEDIVAVFKKRVEKFESDFCKEFDVSESGLELDIVEGLPASISSLSSIAIPPALNSAPSLLQWLSSTSSSSSSIVTLPTQYAKTVELLDRGVIETLLKDCSTLLSKSSQPLMTQIGGLSTRLYTLDQLLSTSKALLKESTSLESSISSTTTRANTLSDPSILPDLTTSHQNSLVLLVDHLRKLADINKRCLKAKEELLGNLNTRLKWVIFLQKNISEINLKIGVYSESLKKFRNLKTVIREISVCGEVFQECLEEMGRRRGWEKAYNEELEVFKSRFQTVFEKEKKDRTKFTAKFGSHFLFSSLFEKLVESSMPSEFHESFHGDYPEIEAKTQELFPPTDLDALTALHQENIEALTAIHAKSIEDLQQQHETELWELKEKHKNELEAVRSRVKFVSKQQQQQKIEKMQEHEENQNDADEAVPSAVQSLSKKLSIHPNGPCKIGDTVLLYYHEKYEAFLVHGNVNGSVHFVHTDCVQELEQEFCYLGNVVDKEYCVARRAQNRYKVPAGFHFYRVKILLTDKYSL